MNLPDTQHVIEIIYRYRMPGTPDRDFYLKGKDVKDFMSQLGGASIMAVTHGVVFKPLNWKVRKSQREGIMKKFNKWIRRHDTLSALLGIRQYKHTLEYLERKATRAVMIYGTGFMTVKWDRWYYQKQALYGFWKRLKSLLKTS